MLVVRQKLADKLSTMKATQVIKILTSEEHKICDERLSALKVDKIVLSKGSKIEIHKLCNDSQYKLTGGEASVLLLGGGAETIFHHMNAYGVNLRLKNREALNVILRKLKDIEVDCEAATSNLHLLLSKIVRFRDLQDTGLSSQSSEEVEIELGSIIDASSQQSEEIENFREEIISLAQDAVKLYSSDDIGIDVDPVMKDILLVFTAFKALYTPVLQASSFDPDILKAEMEGHRERAAAFLQAIKSTNLNINLGFHSDYMHALIAPDHLDAQCTYALDFYGVHLTRLCTEVSEGNHRILRNILTRMQPYTKRPVGDAAIQRFFGDVIFNKMSYVMHDSLVRIFHFFSTLVPKKEQYTCGICGSFDHTQRACKARCDLCGNYYFKGHSKKTCKLIELPLSPEKVIEV